MYYSIMHGAPNGEAKEENLLRVLHSRLNEVTLLESPKNLKECQI